MKFPKKVLDIYKKSLQREFPLPYCAVISIKLGGLFQFMSLGTKYISFYHLVCDDQREIDAAIKLLKNFKKTTLNILHKKYYLVIVSNDGRLSYRDIEV